MLMGPEIDRVMDTPKKIETLTTRSPTAMRTRRMVTRRLWDLSWLSLTSSVVAFFRSSKVFATLSIFASAVAR